MKSKRVSALVVDALEDMKGQSIRCIGVSKLTSITDFMVIVTGTSNTHIKALADSTVKRARESDVKIIGVEGRLQAEWVLVDLGDVVVHIMTAPVRALYNLEELWNFSLDKSAAEKAGEKRVENHPA
ncbi:MAG TPA: ribosome silencing factor [Gammaproteobacteria bacterium]|nr:ribosome silencing factor [Gammaproteobacteria bacterium]